MPVTIPLGVELMLYPARQTFGYGQLLLKDIPASQFGHMPRPGMNHPAFNIGHLSLYPNRAFELLGMPERAVARAGWPELFKAGVACVEQDGRYPARDEIVAHYVERHTALLEALPEVEEDVLRRENPAQGRFREMFPTVGTAVNFLLNNHHMTHLGQVSAWRRVVGLPSVT